MSLPPLACWESKVAGQEYQICRLDFYSALIHPGHIFSHKKAQKAQKKVQRSSFSLLAYNRDRSLKAEL
jgi:hypothetical protein